MMMVVVFFLIFSFFLFNSSTPSSAAPLLLFSKQKRLILCTFAVGKIDQNLLSFRQSTYGIYDEQKNTIARNDGILNFCRIVACVTSYV